MSSEFRCFDYYTFSQSLFRDLPAWNCFLGKMFFGYLQRNAWRTTRISQYFGSRAFHPTFQAASSYVESERQQGSTWFIDELPVIVVTGVKDALIVTEIFTMTPFREFKHPVCPGATFCEIARAMNPHSSDTVIPLLSEMKTCQFTVLDTAFRYQRWKAKSQAANQPFDWEGSIKYYNIVNLLDVVKAITVAIHARHGRVAEVESGRSSSN